MEFLVTLYRDSLQTPWGFRLEGGRDFKTPLTIQRVFTGTPASSDLLRGDIITSIHNEDANYLFHNEANELIRTSGGSLHLGIKRNPGAEFLQFQPFQSYKKTMDFGGGSNFVSFTAPQEEDVSKRYRNSQMDTINHYKNPKPAFSQTGSPFLPDYQPFTVGECSSVQRKIENRLAPRTELNYSKPSYPRFNNTNSAAQPYVDRRMIGNIQQNLTRAVHAPGHFTQRPSSSSVPALPKTHMKIGKYDVKSFANQPGIISKSPSISSNHGALNQSSSPLPPKVVVKQYNSPIGLYSNNTLKEELNKQIQFTNATEFSNANTNSASEF